MGKNNPSIDEVINLFDQGMRPSLEIDREEAIKRGYMAEDTKETRLVQFKGELVEIDYRKRVSASGDKIIWIAGQHPKTRQALKKIKEMHDVGTHPGRSSRKNKKTISGVLKQFMQTAPSRKEFDKLPKSVKNNLEEYLGRGLTRADIAAFVLMGKAMEGDIMAFKEIADRTEGKAIQRTENKHVHGNYTDFLKGLAGFDDDDEDQDPYIDV